MPLAYGSGTLTEVQIPLQQIAASQATIAASQATIAADVTARQIEEGITTAAALVQIALQIAQLVFYYDRFDDAIDERDAKIDAQIAFLDTLEGYKTGMDKGMANKKRSVLTGLGLPSVDLCRDSILFRTQHQGDGMAVDLKARQLSQESCDGIPSGWGVHEGSLMAAKSGSYAGGLLGNSAKRDREEFQVQKTQLVRAGQIGMKGVFRSGDTLGMYSQAAAIHSGLADIYLQGFNSAGAGLGSAIGQFGNSGKPQLVGAEPAFSPGNAAINFQGQGDFGNIA